MSQLPRTPRSQRLPPISGEWIDRSQSVSFTFEGQRFRGYIGDTITSALWAAGQRVLGRSFKYHRPRGILSLANHDINALMQNGAQLNVRADVTPVADGMNLIAVNTLGGVMGDRASVINLLAPLLPVGFYYKAFHHQRLFPVWERLIRTMTGLGKLESAPPHSPTPKRYDFCDVLVIGGGVSGLAAAIAAAEAGADVVIVEENANAGGAGRYQLRGDRSQANKTLELLEAVTEHPRIRLQTTTQAAGYYADHWVPLIDAQRLTKMRAKAVIVASGASEQPAVFRQNDLPGVMLASAAQRLIYRYAVKPMDRAVVLVANRDGYGAALDLVHHGIKIMAIVDLREQPPQNPWIAELRSQGIPMFVGHCLYEARPNPAGDGVASAVICPLATNGKPQIGFQQVIACDGIVMSVGWAPTANLLYQAGAKMRFDDALQQFVPEHLPTGVFACGRVNGVFEWEQKLLDGHRAGWAAAWGLLGSSTHAKADSIPLPPLPMGASDPPPESPSHPYPFVEHPAGKNFVDFDEDLQLKDFRHAAQEGFDNIELLKRYTTVGMGSSQGKHANMNALRILARITGESPGAVGTTTARPFFHPVPLSHLAGRGFTPERRTPLQDHHGALGAEFMPAGIWLRPAYYAQPGLGREECLRKEAVAVRTQVGMVDVGTLGKLEVYGPDGVELLERVYTGRYANLPIGMSRYALMLDETGVVMDDGVVARRGSQHFYFTTTTAGSANIYRELTRLQTLWRLDCGIVNLTGAHAAINLAGPAARDLLAQLTDLDLSGTAFPYLAVRDAVVAGIPALLMRVGFVGEWGYEIHVAAEWAIALWEVLLEAGKPYDLAVFGVEAQRLLRLEKAHLIIGQDTDGLTTPREAGLAWAVKMDKPVFYWSTQFADSSPAIAETTVGWIHPGGRFSGYAPPRVPLSDCRGGDGQRPLSEHRRSRYQHCL
ncbi:2Fe-2S iron-sulfur cluster-binding protein [Neosynechococcus sphagnicola]|uniref:2Fe-2S iron-sulfur cluster-binding protein n=1 Tax=Neosynechococcus sphagnicola TaxID=1501145 RepID=UPI001EF9EAD0|nr:2Fe-2S iron-sulfur cluster-binding protein [Neosynechococcus sphagnicola]